MKCKVCDRHMDDGDLTQCKGCGYFVCADQMIGCCTHVGDSQEPFCNRCHCNEFTFGPQTRGDINDT